MRWPPSILRNGQRAPLIAGFLRNLRHAQIGTRSGHSTRCGQHDWLGDLPAPRRFGCLRSLGVDRLVPWLRLVPSCWRPFSGNSRRYNRMHQEAHMHTSGGAFGDLAGIRRGLGLLGVHLVHQCGHCGGGCVGYLAVFFPACISKWPPSAAALRGVGPHSRCFTADEWGRGKRQVAAVQSRHHRAQGLAAGGRRGARDCPSRRDGPTSGLPGPMEAAHSARITAATTLDPVCLSRGGDPRPSRSGTDPRSRPQCGPG